MGGRGLVGSSRLPVPTPDVEARNGGGVRKLGQTAPWEPWVRVFNAGQISGAIWENETDVNGTSKTVLKASLSRRYKDRDGNWQSSQSFSRNEIFLAVHCLQQAVERIIEEETVRSGNGNDGVGEGVRVWTAGRPRHRTIYP